MAKRKSISKKDRFEILKRDCFKCQYCGAAAPDVLLHVDHIHPVSKDGSNEIINLITSCEGCNFGKSDRLLSDSSVLDKQRNQLEKLQERREQLDMMFKWQESLSNIASTVVDRLSDIWNEHTGHYVSKAGEGTLRRHLKKYSFEEITSAMQAAADTYLRYDGESATLDSGREAFEKIGGVCYMTRVNREDPDLDTIYYIRSILRKRANFYVDEVEIFPLLRRAMKCGIDHEQLKAYSRKAFNLSQFQNGIEGFCERNESEDGTEE